MLRVDSDSALYNDLAAYKKDGFDHILLNCTFKVVAVLADLFWSVNCNVSDLVYSCELCWEFHLVLFMTIYLNFYEVRKSLCIVMIITRKAVNCNCKCLCCYYLTCSTIMPLRLCHDGEFVVLFTQNLNTCLFCFLFNCQSVNVTKCKCYKVQMLQNVNVTECMYMLQSLYVTRCSC